MEYPLSCEGLEPPEPIFEAMPESDETIQFGEVQVNTTSNQVILLKNEGEADLTVDVVSLTGTHAGDFQVQQAHNFPATIRKQERKPLIISCKPSQAGIRTATLMLSTNDDMFITAVYYLECNGKPEPSANVSLFPVPEETLTFGKTVVNTQLAKAITATETGTLPVTVEYAAITGDHANDFSFKPPYFFTIADGGAAKTMQVTCQPSGIGQRRATLHLRSNVPGKESMTYPLSCQGLDYCTPNFEPDAADADIIGELGDGYDSDRQRIKPNACLNGTITEVGAGWSSLTGDLIYDHSELKNDLSIKASGGFSYGLFEMDAKAEFTHSTIETATSQSMITKFTMQLPHGRFKIDGNNPLTENGKGAIESSCKFRKICGDQFITQTTRGASLYAALMFDFASEADKKRFFTEVSGSYIGVANFKASMEKISEHTRSRGRVTIRVLQQGGRVENLGKTFFGEEDEEISPFIQCSLAKLDKCETAMNNILLYVKGSFAEGVKEKPETLAYHFARYDEVTTRVPPLEEDVTPEITQVRGKLAEQFELLYYDLFRVKAKEKELHQFMDDENRRIVINIRNQIHTNLEIIQNAAQWCFSDLAQCVSKAETALQALKPYDLNSIKIKVTREYSQALTDISLHENANTCITNKEGPLCLPDNCQLNTAIPDLENGYSVNKMPTGYAGTSLTQSLDSTKHCLTTTVVGCAQYVTERYCKRKIFGHCIDHSTRRSPASRSASFIDGRHYLYGRCEEKLFPTSAEEESYRATTK